MEPYNENSIEPQNNSLIHNIKEPLQQNIYKVQPGQFQPALYGQWRLAAVATSLTAQHPIIFNRKGHCQFFYKNSIFVYGGKQVITTMQSGEQMEGALGQEVSRKESLWNSFHKYNTSSREFQRQPINFGPHAALFTNLSQFGWVVLGNLLFLFGGINYETESRRATQIQSINLDNNSIKRYESKTTFSSIPTPRLNPTILPIQKTMLLVFGGEVYNNLSQSYISLNDIYTFKIQSKAWTRIEDTINSKIPLLVSPYLFNFGDSNMYLFGGRRQVLGNDGQGIREIQEDGVYRLRLTPKSVNAKIDCNVRRVCVGGNRNRNEGEIRRVGAMIRYGQKGVFAIQQANQQKQNRRINMWYFDLNSLMWIEVRQNYDDDFNWKQIDFNLNLHIATSYQKLYILQNHSIFEFSFNQTFLQSTLNQGLTSLPSSICFLCEQQRATKPVEKNIIPYQYLQEYCSALEFPYSAIGLLVDNAISTNATHCSVFFNTGQFGVSENTKSVHLVVEDNGLPGQIWGQMKASEYSTKISNFYATVLPEDMMAVQDNRKQFAKSLKQIEQKQKNLQRQFSNFMKSHAQPPASIQKPTTVPSTHFSLKTQKDFEKEQQEYIEKKQRLNYKKKQFERQQKFKRFCNNLKIAGLRLGDFVAYACKQKKSEDGGENVSNGGQIRRFYFLRKEKEEKSGKSYFVGYAYVLENNNLADSKMEGIFKYCTKEFKKQLKLLTQRLKSMNSVFLICDLKDIYYHDEQTSSERQQPIYKQMRLKKKQNDVFYGQPSLLTHLQTNSISKMSECCDISLKTYLALLYLNNPNLNLYLTIRENQTQQINTQPFLTTIDRWLSSKKILQMTKSLDFSDQCSVVQVYWYPEFCASSETIANKINGLGFLLNGVLVYHKGRLVGRYGVKLGRLLDQLENQTRAGSMFGYLQVKPDYSSNLYFNDFFYPNTLQKYFSRIKFVSEYMQTKYKDKRSRNKGDELHHLQRVNKRLKNQKNE